ncbi:MAG: efflux RND transporter periplasmic adaptor subunit [Kofleriaceae bacterium]
MLAGLLWWVLRGRAPPKHRAMGAPPTVVIAQAEQGDMHVYLDSIGTVTPVATVSIASQVTGRVIAVHYREGQHVRQGDPLIDIDPRPFQAALLQAQGTLERDLQVLAQSRMDLERFREAWARKAIPRQQLEDQEKLLRQNQGTVKIDRGALELAQVQLSYCHLTSPVTGRVGLQLVDPGNLVESTTGTPLVVITQIQPITVVFTIPEDALGEVAEAARGAQLAVDAFDRTRTRRLDSGVLIAIDNLVDTTTGTVKLRAQFDNTHEQLFPNQFVNTRLLVRTLRGVTMLPSSAIQHDGRQAFVYVVQDDRVHLQRISTGAVEAGKTQVSGLAPGTQVANSSFEKLVDGARIAISEQAPSAPGSGSGSGSAAP